MNAEPTTHRRSTTWRRWTVIGLSWFLFLTGCTATTTIESTSSPATAVDTSVDAPSTGESATPSTPDASTEPPEPATPTATDTTSAPDETTTPADPNARFVLRGDLPLSTEQVNDLIDFIEADTGRSFLRPPVIVAQSREVFMEGLLDDLDDFDTDAEVAVRTLQALGLTNLGVGEVSRAFRDLLLSPEGILGYYDPVPDELYVPVDSAGDDDFRLLLVHELTHALDGQYVDLNVLDALVEEAKVSGDYEPVVALQAVAEGRASSVQNRWMAANDVTQTVPEDLGALADVPASMVLSLSIPYAFGAQFIETNGGAAETWGWLENPPASSEEFMVAGTPHDERIVDVPTPAADGPVIDDFVYGASDIFVWLLGESLDPDPTRILPTFAAVDGWAGGRAVLWGDDNESCIRIALAADTSGDLAELQSAIALWADGDPDRSVETDGDLVVATGCARYVP